MAVALASGNPAALPQGMPGGSYDQALQAALAKGLSLQDALAHAAAVDAYERSVAAAEARNAAYGFSSGSMVPPVVDAAFDQAGAQFDPVGAGGLRSHQPVDAFDADFNQGIGHYSTVISVRSPAFTLESASLLPASLASVTTI